MKQFGISESEFLELCRPIYSMKNAGDYWRVKVENHVKNDLGAVSLARDPCLYIKWKDKVVDGLLAMFFEDRDLAGNEKCGPHQTKAAQIRELDSFDFFSTRIVTITAGQ